MSRMSRWMAGAILVLAPTMACDEQNPFRNTSPLVTDGTGQVWELALEGFPSGWIFSTGRRFFVGTGPVPSNGTWVLDALDDGSLVFRQFEDVAPGLSLARTGILDLTEADGTQTFEAVRTVPASGYVDDPVAVVEGHVYAFRITQLGGIVVPINYGKLEVIEVGREDPADPRSRFVAFRWAYQHQPLNRDVAVEGE